MTLQTLREHEGQVLDMYKTDYRRLNLEELALRYVERGPVLDSRTFSGTLAVELAARGFEVVGLDGHERAVQIANERARSRGVERPIVELWDLEGLVERVGKNRFETVLCLDLLSHVRDDRETMDEISTTLIDGGRLILMAPAHPGLHGKRDESLGHLRRYSKDGLQKLLEDSAFRVDSMRYWSFAGLPLYFFFEKILKKGVSQELRCVNLGFLGSLPNTFLTWWYAAVENRLILPWGLSLFVIAHKDSSMRTRSTG